MMLAMIMLSLCLQAQGMASNLETPKDKAIKRILTPKLFQPPSGPPQTRSPPKRTQRFNFEVDAYEGETREDFLHRVLIKPKKKTT